MNYFVICYDDKNNIFSIQEIREKTKEEIKERINKANNKDRHYVLIEDEKIIKIIEYYENYYNSDINEDGIEIQTLKEALEDIKDITEKFI